MSDSEFMRRIAPPPRKGPLPEHTLWTLKKDGRYAEARLRVLPHGLEFRVFMAPLGTTEIADLTFLESRVFRAQDGGTAGLHDYALEVRRGFEVRGWTLQLHATTDEHPQ